MADKIRMRRKSDLKVLDYYSKFSEYTVPCTDGGFRYISPQELIKYARDPEAWEAEANGVSVEALRAFEKYREGGYYVQCSEITQKYERCGNWFHPDPGVWDNIAEYGKLVYKKKFQCWVHK